MNLFKHHATDETDRAVRRDRSAHFIYTFALGLPKSLATMKAASDCFDGLQRTAIVPSPAPIMERLTSGAVLPQASVGASASVFGRRFFQASAPL